MVARCVKCNVYVYIERGKTIDDVKHCGEKPEHMMATGEHLRYNGANSGKLYKLIRGEFFEVKANG